MTEQKPYDPKLRLAISEIREILKRHDIAGTVNIQSKTHGEFLSHFTPSWSLLKIEVVPGQGIGYRLKTKGPLSKEDHEKLECTVGLFYGQLHACEKLASHMKLLIGKLKEQVEIESSITDTENTFFQ